MHQPDPPDRLLHPGRRSDGGGAVVVLLRLRTAGHDVDPVRQPAGGQVPVLLAGVRGRHVPPHPGRRRGRQGRPRDGWGRTRWCSPPSPRPRSGTSTAIATTVEPADPTPRRHGASTAGPRPATRSTRTGTSCWGSRCAGSATTTPPTSCGSGGPPSCGGGSPSRSNGSLAHRLGVEESKLNEHVTVQYSKVAEYQRRGLIHFHALIRLDGPKTDDGFAPAPGLVDRAAAGRGRRGSGTVGPVHRPTRLRRRRRPGAGVRGPGRLPPGEGRPPHRRPERTPERRSRSPGTSRSTRPSPPPTPSTATGRTRTCAGSKPWQPSSPPSSRTNGSRQACRAS